ncbi:MAG TPA: RagB/SusD family nutrient uptake outer membrane protein [Chitinophaga sp.]
MKIKMFLPVLCIAMAGMLGACRKKFLEVVPMGDLVLTTTNDYDQVMNDPDLYYTPSGGWSEAVLMGNELAAEGTFFNNKSVYMTRLFQWQDSIYQMADRTPPFISDMLGKMYTLNLVIRDVMSATDGSEARKKALRAEALATRAWMNFQLINYYALPYQAATAATDPGFPIIDKPDITIKKYDRGTVQQMYDFIIRDLTAAVQDLPVKQAIATRMSRPAAEGLLGKVYLFMGNSTDALPMLDAALNDVAANGAPTLYDYNQAFGPGGSFLPIDPTFGPAGPGNNRNDLKEAVLSKVFYNGPYQYNLYGTDGLVLSAATQALYGPSDLRRLLYTTKNPDGSVNTAGRLRKYGVTYSRMGLQLPELYLLRAECRARLNNLGGATADLETLRRSRMPPADAAVPAPVAASQPQLIRFVIDERTREFAQEGYRWFDMRRLSVDPLFTGMVFTHTLYNSDGTTTVYTLQQPQRLVLQIPPKIAISNPGFQNNP